MKQGKLETMEKNIKKLTLLLMYLTSWEEENMYCDKDDNLNKDKLKALEKVTLLMLLMN